MAERDRRLAAYQEDNGEVVEDVARSDSPEEDLELPEHRDADVPTPRTLPKRRLPED